jgi:hypothetical protein
MQTRLGGSSTAARQLAIHGAIRAKNQQAARCQAPAKQAATNAYVSLATRPHQVARLRQDPKTAHWKEGSAER